MGLQEPLEELRGEQGRVAGEHEDVAGAPLELHPRGRDGVAGPARPLLDGDREAREGVARLGRGDDDERVGVERAGRLEHPVDEPEPEQGVQVLRRRRPHAGAEAGGHHHG